MRLVILLLLMTTPVLAGPWPRAPGAQFMSMSVEGNHGIDRAPAYGSLYYEYGLWPRLTLGVDAGMDSWGQSGTLIFARMPIVNTASGHWVTGELGVGAFGNLAGSEPALRPGLSWGRHLDIWQGGWVSLEAKYTRLLVSDQEWAKLEATMGLNHGTRVKYLLQVTAESFSGLDPMATVTPALAFRVGKSFHLVGGIIARSDGSAALKLGLWADY